MYNQRTCNQRTHLVQSFSGAVIRGTVIDNIDNRNIQYQGKLRLGTIAIVQ